MLTMICENEMFYILFFYLLIVYKKKYTKNLLNSSFNQVYINNLSKPKKEKKNIFQGK